MSTLPVVYQARGVDVLRPTKAEIALLVTGHPVAAAALYYEHNVRPYVESIEEGIAQTVKEARIVVSDCPNATLVLGGYSQGAMVIHQAELRLDDRSDAAVHDAIAGTLLLGDGDRVPHSHARLFGTAATGGEGVRTYLRGIHPHDVDEPPSTAEICNSQDIVCDFDLNHVRSTKRASKASAVHTGYLAHDPAVLDRAVDWVATRLLKDVGPGGLVGPLQIDASTTADVIAMMGNPDVAATGNFISGDPDYYALGYGCAPGTTGPAPGNCGSIFYINTQTGRLAALAVGSTRFLGPAGIYAGESATQAERRVHAQPFSGCEQGFSLGSRRTRAQMLVEVAGGQPTSGGGLRGGHVADLLLESNTEPVGLLFC